MTTVVGGEEGPAAVWPETGWRDPVDGLVYAFLLDGEGGARSLSWDEVARWSPSDGALWIHLDYREPRAIGWLREEAGVDPLVCDALLVDEVRPRLELIGGSLLVGLRGVNLNPGADPDDMVSLRVWAEPRRLITLRHRRILAVRDVREAITAGRGPRDMGELLASLAGRLVDRMGPVLAALDDAVDDVEERVVDGDVAAMRSRLATLRRQAISMRRHLAPQREVMASTARDERSWLSQEHRLRFRELQDRIMQYVEDLDEARERAAVTHEEVTQQLAEQTNRQMFVLALVAAIFLPLSLLTGLLGINVAGIPGDTWDGAFWAVAGLLVVLGGLEVWLLWRMRWF